MLKKLSCLLLTAVLLVASLSIPARAEGKWVALGTGDVAEVRFESLENEKYPNFKFRCRVRLKEDKSDMPLCCTVPLGDLIEDYISANPSQKGRKVDASKIKVDISTVQEASTVYKMTMKFSIGTVSTTIDTRIDLARFFPIPGL